VDIQVCPQWFLARALIPSLWVLIASSKSGKAKRRNRGGKEENPGRNRANPGRQRGAI